MERDRKWGAAYVVVGAGLVWTVFLVITVVGNWSSPLDVLMMGLFTLFGAGCIGYGTCRFLGLKVVGHYMAAISVSAACTIVLVVAYLYVVYVPDI